MDAIFRLIDTILEFVIHAIDSIDLLLTGWSDLPGELAVFASALGPAGDVISTVIYLCIGMLVLRLLTMIIELIPGF